MYEPTPLPDMIWMQTYSRKQTQELMLEQGAAEYARGVADSAAEIERLRAALDEINDHAPWGGTKDTHIAWMQNFARAALKGTP